MSPRVGVVEDHAMIRAGLAALLQDHGFAVVPLDSSPEVLLVDWTSKDLDASLRSAAKRATRCVVYGRPMTAGLAIYALDHGADVIISDSDPFERVLAALRLEELPPLAGELATEVLEVLMRRQRLPSLSPREVQTIRLLDQGADLDDVAMTLGIKSLTARNHSQRAQRKLGAHSQHEAVLAARQLGYVG